MKDRYSIKLLINLSNGKFLLRQSERLSFRQSETTAKFAVCHKEMVITMNGIIRTLNSLTDSTLGMLIVSLAFGVFLALLFTLFQRCVIGVFIRRLIQSNSFSPDNAKTLDELGIKKNVFVFSALKRRKSLLNSLTLSREEATFTAEEADAAKEKKRRVKRDIKSLHFYIPDSRRKKAEALFCDKSLNPILVVLSFLLLLAAMLLLIKLIPNIINLASVMIG